MKKTGNIIYWLVIIALAFGILFRLYERYRPEINLKQVQQQEAQERSLSRQGSNEGTADQQGGKGETADGENASESGDAKDDSPKKVMAPDFTLEDINGNKVKLSDYRGKIVFLNFWAVWCPYCVMEMPDLDAANAEFAKGEDAVILAIDVQEDAGKVKKFINDKKLTLPVLMDYDGSVSMMYGVNAFPTTFVVDRDGTVYGYHTGPLTKEQVLNVVERIKGGRP